MKKFLILALFFNIVLNNQHNFFKVKENLDDKLVLSFLLEEYELENQQGYINIKVDKSGTAASIGEPLLPSLSSFIQVDKNSSYTIDYKIISEKEYLNKEIKPLQNFNYIENNNAINNQLDYNSNQYPNNNLNISNRIAMRGNELINIEVTPFTYYPIDKKLIVLEEIEITIQKNENINQKISKDFPKSKVFERLVNSLVLNPINTNSTRNEEYQQPHILYVCGGNSSSNSFFNQLIQWRRKQGYEVSVVSTNLIGNSTTNIKNYLENSMTWDNPPEFVTLVGDVGGSFDIDTFIEYDSGYNGEGDHPYSQLDGNDLLPEVILGRISVRTSTELATVINKIISYEQAYNMEDAWYERAGLVGDPSTSGISTVITSQNIAEKMINYGMEDVRLKISGGSYDNWMVNELSNGVGYLNYRGYYGVSGFGSSDVDAANNGYKLPFATIITCGTGSFASESQCLSEKFIRAGSTTTPKGAVACVGTATIGTHTLFNNAINLGIYQGIFVNNFQTTGEALAAGKLNLYQNYPSNPSNWVKIFTYWTNLMGDSATPLWTGNPIVMNVEHQNSINAGQNFMSANITANDSPIKNALVTLVDSEVNGFYKQGFTDENGNVTLNFEPNEITENIEITVTKFGHKPYMNSLNFINEQIPYAQNEDASLSTGEISSLIIPIFYDGQTSLGNLSATISSNDNVEIINGISSYNIQNIGEDGNYPSQPFEVMVKESQTHNSTINFEIKLTDDSGNDFFTNASYLVESFKIDILNNQLSGNDCLDGNLDPEDTCNLYFLIKNDGLVSSPELLCEISSESNDLSFSYNDNLNSNIEIQINSIQPNQTDNSSNIVLYLADTAFDSDSQSLNIFCESNSENSDFEFTDQENINIGAATVNDPTGPDSYGYYIYDYGDQNYSLMPSYEWIDIESIGTPLSVVNNDDGDNQDEVQLVQLPFNFGFYGENYNEISVSSNGWISFGETDLVSFRNDYLPGPAGPAPMLAVFWDDLTADSGGVVYSYYDNILNVFIIQWNNVKTYEDNSNESFQAILFDPQYYNTPTGDGEILLQYEDFNNTSNGGYVDGVPVHGAYCTIGLEDHTGTVGLEYTFNNSWARSGRELSDETALFISTRKTGSVFNTAQPELILSTEQLNFEINGEESQSENIIFTNNGEEESILSYSIETSPFQYFKGKDNYGNYWLDSNEPNNNYEWIDINTNESNVINFENNDSGETINIDFDFKFYGESYNQVIVHANGWVGFGDNNDVYSNGPLPNSNGPKNAIFGFWDDLNPINDSGGGNPSGYVYYQNFEDKVVIWFNDIARYWSNDPNYSAVLDFQIVLYKNQLININYRTVDGYLTSGTVGIQNNNASDAIQVAYNSEYVQNELTLSFKPADWVTIDDQNFIFGELLNYGESKTYEVTAYGDLIQTENETAYLIINSNSNTQIEPIPIIVEYSDGLLGDLNNDGILNILDIVALVNIVLNDEEYNSNADLNSDGILNVLDIVNLVNLVLNP